ncbi:hypothetical protein CL617_03665 [archaeon]|nr:hypothetical protein [archaeon]|tara:strand:- start:4408 stop:5460 length:1053 start_codon:yes stop_codon:yes gene_type:complete
MKILLNSNNSGFQAPGGGEILLSKTKEFLLKKGIDVKLFDQWNDKLEDFDILHNFGLSNNCYDVINVAHNKKVPIAITPIYSWPSLKFAFKSGTNFKDKVKLGGYALTHNTPFFNRFTYASKMLNMADRIITDSKAERDVIDNSYKLNKDKYRVIPYAIDRRFYDSDSKEFVEKYGLKDFILYTGRIEPRKNVHKLIKIVNKLKYPLVIVGGKNYQEGDEYYKLCVKEAGDNKDIIFLDRFDHDSTMLGSAYAAAKMVALPSWLENPGLSVLEGGLAGANILITSRGSPKEYFENYAHYVDPFDDKDIEKKLVLAYEKDKDNKLREHILNNFTWEVATDRMIKCYKDLLN